MLLAEHVARKQNQLGYLLSSSCHSQMIRRSRLPVNWSNAWTNFVLGVVELVTRSFRCPKHNRLKAAGSLISNCLLICLLPIMAKRPAEVGQKKRQQGVHFKEPKRLMLLAEQVAWKQNQLGYLLSSSCHSQMIRRSRLPVNWSNAWTNFVLGLVELVTRSFRCPKHDRLKAGGGKSYLKLLVDTPPP